MGMILAGGVTLSGGMSLLSSGSSGGPDPYFANVVLLLHGDGVNGGTVFTDSSSYSRTPSSVISVTTSNEQTLFGQNTIKSINERPDSGGSVLEYASSMDFAASQTFTVEFQIYLPSSFNGPYFMARGPAMGGYAAINSFFQPIPGGHSLTFTNYPGNPGGYLTPNAWNYVAYSANATETNLYINGTRVETQGPGTPDPNPYPFNIVSVPGRADLTAAPGYLAEIRYTQGVARYTGASIPLQTAPWPNN